MINLLYGTDFHGNEKKFEDILFHALEYNIPLIHLGCDILPKGSNILSEQKKFVNGYLKNFYDRCHKHGIEVLAFWGNDDVYTRKKYFLKYASLLDETPYVKNGYTFKAYPYVQDYPFGLKTACKLDRIGWKCPDPYVGKPIDCGDAGFEPIQDIEEYFSRKGTIEDDLMAIRADRRTIMAIHQPPAGLGLDVCLNGHKVGSEAVYNWIEREKPLCVLSGHIHESYQVTGEWKVKIGETVVIQPGQKEYKTTLVYIELLDDLVKAEIIQKG